ncbi:MAG: polysaccharide deacetylase family protein, partial [Calditrichaeota bacterium]|nr:polysaccharide deacetylase family protein [Calditrichota bacterium]
ITEENREKISHGSDGKFIVALPRLKLKEIEKWLSCRDVVSPDDEPGPIDTPLMDNILYDWHRQIINFCREKRQIFLYKMPWPSGKSLALSISHDVDLTRKYGIKALITAGLKGRLTEFRDYFRKSVYQDNIYWNFDEFLNFYRMKEFKSSFFFIARSWEGRQYRYNINTQKFRKLFREISEAGHEIGLHSSRYAFDFPERIASEKAKLEENAGRPVTGVRQHYLRLMFPQAWKYFGNAGFYYDSSCGYNKRPGFRAATSFPFRTRTDETHQENLLWEIPFSIMDYSWFYRKEDGNEVFRDIVKKIEQTGGLVHVLWHPSNLAEKTFHPLWSELIDWMEKKEFYNDTLHQIAVWREKRSGVNSPGLTNSDDFLEFILKTEQVVSDLSLGILSPKSFVPDPSLVLLERPDHYQLTIPTLNPGEHLFRLKYNN